MGCRSVRGPFSRARVRHDARDAVAHRERARGCCARIRRGLGAGEKVTLLSLHIALLAAAFGYLVAKSRIGSPIRAALDMIFARHEDGSDAHAVVALWRHSEYRWLCARCSTTMQPVPVHLPLLAEGYHCPVCLSGELALILGIIVSAVGLASPLHFFTPAALAILISLLVSGGDST